MRLQRKNSFKNQLKVSVAIICHNYGRFLGSCFDSVIRQTYKPQEIFVVDDSSTDTTASVCESLGLKRIYVEHKDVHRTRETAFQQATGDVIIFLDADDELSSKYLEVGCQLFSDPRVAIVYSDVEYFGNQTGRSQYPEFSLDVLCKDNFIHAGSLVRRDALRLSQPFSLPANSSTHADWILWKRVCNQGWLAAKQSAIYRYRKHGRNMSLHSAYTSYHQKADLANEPVTLFVPLSGRESLWTRFSSQLLQITDLRSVSLILYDTSQSKSFGNLLVESMQQLQKRCDVRYVKAIVGEPGLADLDRRTNVSSVRSSMARIYDWARKHITTNYVLLLEDDIFVPGDIVERLLKGFDEKTDAISVPYLSRFHDGYVAWNLVNGLPQSVKERGNGLTPICGTGFGCVLMRTALLREQMFSDTPHTPSGGISHDFDIAFWMRASQLGRQAKIDWTIQAEHVGLK